MAIDLPDDMNRLIASYVKPKFYSEMSVSELHRMKHQIDKALEEKEKINKDDSSDKYMVIRAEYFGKEHFFKIDKTKYSNDLSDYEVRWDSLYYKGEELETEICEDEVDFPDPCELEWCDFEESMFVPDELLDTEEE